MSGSRAFSRKPPKATPPGHHTFAAGFFFLWHKKTQTTLNTPRLNGIFRDTIPGRLFSGRLPFMPDGRNTPDKVTMIFNFELPDETILAAAAEITGARGEQEEEQRTKRLKREIYFLTEAKPVLKTEFDNAIRERTRGKVDRPGQV